MLIVDAHLDLAYNALRGRDVLRTAREQIPDADGIPSVGLPDLRAGGVGLICATIFCAPASPKEAGYRTADEAHAMALDQIHWYQQQADAGQIAVVRKREDYPLGTVAQPPPAVVDRTSTSTNTQSRAAVPHAINAIILLEGADPMRSPADVKLFFDAGVRIVGLAWKRTRYAGGTAAPGPLTTEGVELVKELDRFGIIHDTSHLAEESFWQLLDRTGGRVIASHSNCRSIIPTDRQLSNDMIRAIAKRDGVIGINFYDRFLVPPGEYGHRRATLKDVVDHLKHMGDLIGDAAHVGIGTDMDGGLGREQIPTEIETSADLPRVADALADAGFSDADVRGIMGGNWVRFFASALPS